MAIVLPKDPKERLKALLQVANGETAEFEVDGKTYKVVPRLPEEKTKPPKEHYQEKTVSSTFDCINEQTTSGPSIGALVDSIHEWAKRKGWWDGDVNFPEKIAMCHTELSEALEDWRQHGQPERLTFDESDVQVKPEGCASELADLIIRVLDIVGRYEIPIELAIAKKMAHNYTRPYRHGGKKC